MKKTYINPETETFRIAPIVMTANSVGLKEDKINLSDDGVSTYGKDDNTGHGSSLWDD